jgi:Rrf2 family iron-sulfur cluster assembly transcriptional regulator
MMAISTKGRYSVRIMALMASQPQGHMFTKHEIAERAGVSPAYVQQLMMTLNAAGFVHSHRGKAGGFTLAEASEKVTVADVLGATEGKITLVPCLGLETCERSSNCPTRPLWTRATELLDDLFSGVSIAELAVNGANAVYGRPADPIEVFSGAFAIGSLLASSAPKFRPLVGRGKQGRETHEYGRYRPNDECHQAEPCGPSGRDTKQLQADGTEELPGTDIAWRSREKGADHDDGEESGSVKDREVYVVCT